MSIVQHRPSRRALVVGATGIAGSAIVEQLTEGDWEVVTLSRTPVERAGVRHVSADLQSLDSLTEALRNEEITHVFFTAWIRRETENENIDVNSALLRNLLSAVESSPVQHVALLTGLKQYLGPFESFGKGSMPDTPFHEEEPRLDRPNFYYAQEDVLWEAAARRGFTWSVHRSHTIIGHAVGNAMNMALTLAAQATICRELGRPFVFPGSATQWNSLVDMTDSEVLAEQMIWASTTEGVGNEAYNIVNGDVFRWRWMWPRLAGYFGVEAEGFSDSPRPLEDQMKGMEEVWEGIAAKYGLAEPDLSRVASWWHSDSDLGRDIEVVADMSKCRLAGFTGYRRTLDSFIRLFDRYKADNIIPQ
ncbi:SDR family oxidoreductase [Paenarthrobacter sp. NPDC057981]|uniref:SDR family oxidoreductase n=1 Tax=Paenarthrobacter sp. NPDC057981 TaxID=3346297 RepID=UPI0036DD2971